MTTALIFCILDLTDKKQHYIGSSTDLSISFIEAVNQNVSMEHKKIVILEKVIYTNEEHLDRMIDYWENKINKDIL